MHWIDGGDIEELTTIDGIGDKVATIFKEGIIKRRELIEELAQIITVTDEAELASGVLDGQTFCITGSLSLQEKKSLLQSKMLEGR